MKIKCFCDNHKDCLHEWDYDGKSKYYAQCPMCRCFLKIRTIWTDEKGKLHNKPNNILGEM